MQSFGTLRAVAQTCNFLSRRRLESPRRQRRKHSQTRSVQCNSLRGATKHCACDGGSRTIGLPWKICQQYQDSTKCPGNQLSVSKAKEDQSMITAVLKCLWHIRRPHWYNHLHWTWWRCDMANLCWSKLLEFRLVPRHNKLPQPLWSSQHNSLSHSPVHDRRWCHWFVRSIEDPTGQKLSSNASSPNEFRVNNRNLVR